jgi:hypothetical protein
MCYLRGTRLLTPAGEVAVEDLKIGDTLVTRFNGYRRIKWIGRQSFAQAFVRNNFEQIPVRIAAGALASNVPKRDLFVSPAHSMLVDGKLLLAKNLVNGLTITQDWVPEEIHYYQPEFETHDCVLAEGAWSESYGDTPELRGTFHNVAEFYELYPHHEDVAVQALCAARPEAGAVLDAALRSVIARARAMLPAAVAPGPLKGWIDDIDADGKIAGWAFDPHYPSLPVLLEIMLRGTVVASVLACDYRADLAAAKIGRGRAMFEVILAGAREAALAGELMIRRADDGALLTLSEACLRKLELPARQSVWRDIG